ncbi:MAG TPA: SUMF1/EgtB/PvdO family nonheme iron enzyme [Bryobacteraceae bacterium]
MKSPAFISYARADSDFVLRLAGDLKQRGASVWLDQSDITPGQPWDREVERALTACSELLVMLSPASVESQNVMDEVAFALDEGKTVIPVLYSNCRIPFRLRRLEYVDLKSDYKAGLGKLLYALAPGRQAAAAASAAQDSSEAVGQAVVAALSTPATPAAGMNEAVGSRRKLWARTAIGRLEMLAGAVVLVIVVSTAVYRSHRHPPADRPEPGSSYLPAPQTIDNSKGTAPIRATAAPHFGDTRVNAKDGLIYVWIPHGKFTMGCSPGDGGCGDEERPPHEVTLTKAFWIGQTEVTQEAYQRVIGKNPSHFKGAKIPVGYVDWSEAGAFCRAAGGRLPTEAEWEYAARAGDERNRYGDLEMIAWSKGNSGGQGHEAGQKTPNAWGLFDMIGNVWEWVADSYADYPSGSVTDPRGPRVGGDKVQRGGAWDTISGFATVSHRAAAGQFGVSDNTGFRCALD